MKFEGGCYCKAVRYQADAEPIFKGQCHCRECQYLTGGSPNMVMAVPQTAFKYTKGAPKAFKRKDLDNPVTREFCPECGTHLTTRSPALQGAVIVKVGTLDDPSLYGMPQMAIFLKDKQAFHQVPSGIPTFDGVPG